MVDANERRKISQEVYAITGTHVPEDDALVLAALFYNRKLQETAREANDQVKSAFASSRAIVDDVAELARKSEARNKALADAFEARLQKVVRQVLKAQSRSEGPPRGWRGVMAGIAFGILLTGGVITVVCGGSYSWISDARIGAEMRRVVPILPPSLRDKLLEFFKEPPR